MFANIKILEGGVMGVDLLKHNQEAYEKIQEIYKINNKTCIIQQNN